MSRTESFAPPGNKPAYSKQGLALTEQFEGLRLKAYQDANGVWTIGYGHTGPDVHAGLSITQEQAEALLLQDVASAVAGSTVWSPCRSRRTSSMPWWILFSTW